MYDLRGRAALVTGSTQGIGFGIARELARAGSRLVVTGRDRDKAAKAVRELERLGGEALALTLDVTDPDSVANCVAAAIERFSRIDILVNNAGVFQSRLGLELDDEDFNRCLDVNLTGAWRMVRAMVPHFRAQGGGRIINIASMGGRRGVDIAPAYCASKAALINLTQSLAVALGADRINVNAVCPAAVATAMQDEIEALRRVAGNHASGPPPSRALPGSLTAADVGRAVAFLASDYAGAITGQALNVDLGTVMS
jgi:NAD(P)-dependent dehydrogenase (short-subunit alcohol dehydrogenase family)